ncbi:MAG: hypothetical protein ACK4N6_06335, partial [Rhodocyclaceae bacterium]
SVLARLAEDPIVLAPRYLLVRRPRPHPLWALAASVAGVAVVGWVALTGSPQPVGNETRLVAAPAVPVTVASVGGAVPPAPTFRSESAPDGAPDMQEYLLAHQAQAATVRLAETARQIRTVALTATHP